MKKSIRIISLVLVVLMILPLTISAQYPYVVNDTVCVNKLTPTIDGSLDEDWGEQIIFTPPTYDANNALKTQGTVSDFMYFNSKNIKVNGYTYMAYDNDYLYVAAQIYDPDFTQSDIGNYGIDTENFVFDGDTFIFSVDLLLKMSSDEDYYDYAAPSYYVTVDENDNTRFYHVAGLTGGYIDETLNRFAKSEYDENTCFWTVECAISWDTISSDLIAATYGARSLSQAEKNQLLTNGLSLDNKATFIYADRSFDTESEEVISIAAVATTPLSSLDGLPGYTVRGDVVKNYGIKFYINSHIHDIVKVSAKAPTTGEFGNTEYYTCKICNNIYADAQGKTQKTLEDVILKPTAEPFKDVPSGIWYHDSVYYCVEKGYFKGTSATTFSPNVNLTREQFMMVLFNFEGADEKDYQGATGFSDVPSGQWYSAAVKWAKDNNITTGIGGGKFGLGVEISREQFATLLMNYASSKGKSTIKRADISAYKDKGQVSSWALDGIKWAVAEKLMSGTSATTLSPKNIADRATATMLFKNFDIYFYAD